MYRELNISESEGVLAAFNAVCELKEETERLQAECAAKEAELAGLRAQTAELFGERLEAEGMDADAVTAAKAMWQSDPESAARAVLDCDIVEAANPYGCNQYGEGWKMPHNGMSRVRKADLPKKSERKKFFEPTEVKAQAIRNTASLVDGNYKKVSWGNNISVEHINQFNEVVAEMQEKYPLTVEVVKLGSYTGSEDSEGAHCSYKYNDDFTDIRIELQINQDHKYGGVHGLEGWLPYSEKKAENSGFARHNVGVTDAGIDVRSLMIHEYGHALSARCYIASEFRHAFRNTKNPEQVQQYVNAWRQWKYTYERAINSKDIQKVSEYAKENPQEFFAECFTARELGEKLPDYVILGLDNVIKTAKKKP